jgi:choline dehydrogenase-like flavoprotein
MLLYSYGPLYRAVVDGSPLRFAPPLGAALLERLLTLQGYLHSDVSARLALSLRRGPGACATLVVEGRPRPETRPTLRRLEARLRALGPLMRARPIPFAMKVAAPGKSYHTGGTFPMRRDPGPLDSDLLGRPMGLARVHLVDASVFPSVPATNLTLTVMANAYRIASEAGAIDDPSVGRAGAGAAS